MNLFWGSFLRHAAVQATSGSIRTLDGLEAAWVHSALIINNGTYLTSPMSSEGDLRRRLAAAVDDARPHGLPWALYLYEPYVAKIGPEQVASIADSVLDSGAYFSDPHREFGVIARVGAVPVSTATVVALNGWLYVALVATDPDHRKKGYAEAVMRRALDLAASALRVSRTALDASVMGAPLYLQMGYHATGEAWTMYAPI